MVASTGLPGTHSMANFLRAWIYALARQQCTLKALLQAVPIEFIPVKVSPQSVQHAWVEQLPALPIGGLCSEWRSGCCRLPHNETLRPYGVQLMKTALHVLNTDNEENGLLCLRICFDLHKAYRPTLEDQVPPFLDFVRKVRGDDAPSLEVLLPPCSALLQFKSAPS